MLSTAPTNLPSPIYRRAGTQQGQVQELGRRDGLHLRRVGRILSPSPQQQRNQSQHQSTDPLRPLRAGGIVAKERWWLQHNNYTGGTSAAQDQQQHQQQQVKMRKHEARLRNMSNFLVLITYTTHSII